MNYVVIGNGAAAVNAVESIRGLDSTGTITVVSEERYEAYGRPLISYWLSGKVSDDKMVYRPKGFYEKHNVDVRLGVAATSIDPSVKIVNLSDGSVLSYDKLLIATGGKPIVPPMEGLDEVGYNNFMKFDDAKALDVKAHPGRTALVVGGGFIGLKAAEALVKRGIDVELVEKADWVLSTMLDKDAASIVMGELEEHSVNIHTGVVANRVSRASDGLIKVDLSDGTQVSCNMIVIAVGVMPNADIAKACGIAVNRGILVDDNMATSIPDVYAAGDVVEALDVLSGSARVAAIMPNASMQGQIAGRAMAGAEVTYEGSVPFNAVGVFGVSTISIGNATTDLDGCETYSYTTETSYRKLVLKDGKVRGAVFVNDLDRAGIVQGLVRVGADISQFKDSLLSGDLSLINWPEQLRKAMLTR